MTQEERYDELSKISSEMREDLQSILDKYDDEKNDIDDKKNDNMEFSPDHRVISGMIIPDRSFESLFCKQKKDYERLLPKMSEEDKKLSEEIVSVVDSLEKILEDYYKKKANIFSKIWKFFK